MVDKFRSRSGNYDRLTGSKSMISDYDFQAHRGFAYAFQENTTIEQGNSRWLLFECQTPIIIYRRVLDFEESTLEVTLHEGVGFEGQEENKVDIFNPNRLAFDENNRDIGDPRRVDAYITDQEPDLENAETLLPTRIKASETAPNRSERLQEIAPFPWIISNQKKYAFQLENVGSSNIDPLNIFVLLYEVDRA